jgi:hypothetical protein
MQFAYSIRTSAGYNKIKDNIQIEQVQDK